VINTDQSQLAGALDALWTRFLPDLESRIALLESAAEALRSGNLSQAQREEAHSAAHKLAGVLGTFGLTRGTDLARELETLYSDQDGQDSLPAESLAEIGAELRRIVAARK
jgi:HPt (histidine-containing phosphotransfer) domain-containing protein